MDRNPLSSAVNADPATPTVGNPPMEASGGPSVFQQESAEQLRRIANRVPGVLYQYRLFPDGRAHFPFISDALKAVFQIDPEEAVKDGARMFEVIHEDDVAGLMESIRESARNLSSWVLEFRVRRADGQLRWVLGHSVPELESGGSILWHGLLTDITDSKVMQETLRLQAEVMSHMSQGVVVVSNRDSTIVYANPTFGRMMGYAPDELVGRGISIINAPGERTADEVATEIMNHLRMKGAWAGEVQNRRKDGSRIWCRASIASFHHAVHGSLWISVHTDITAEKQHEAMRWQSQKREAIGLLAGGVAHEFNNILAVMMLNLEMFESEVRQGRSEGMLAEMENLCKRASGVIMQLLAFSRQSVLKPEVLDLGELMEAQCRLLGPLLGEQVDIRFAGGGQRSLVNADRGLLQQVFMNLCLNARDAMGGAGIIQVRVAESEAGGEVDSAAAGRRHVVLSVADSGCGMSEEVSRRVFDPFFTTKGVGEGSGLGLSTVRGIVEQHRGWVEVESELGKGSCFRVHLPLVDAAVEVGPGDAAGRVGVSSHPFKPARRRVILLAEDDAALRSITKALFERAGFEVHACGNAEEALRLWDAHQGRIDLLMTDVIMPGGVSGTELAAKLQSRKPDLKVVVFSGYGSDLPAVGSTPAAAFDYLAKPYSMRTLMAVVERSLHGEENARGLGI